MSRTSPGAGDSSAAAGGRYVPPPTEADPLLGLAAATGGLAHVPERGHAHAGSAHLTIAPAPAGTDAALRSYGSRAADDSASPVGAAAAHPGASLSPSPAGELSGAVTGDDMSSRPDETEDESNSPLDSAVGYVVRPATAGSARSARSAGSWAGTAPPKLGLADGNGDGGSGNGALADLTRAGLHAYASCYGVFLTAQLTFCSYAIYLWAVHRGEACAHPLAVWLLVHGITGIVFLIPVCCLFLVLTNAIGAVLVARRRQEEVPDHPYGRTRRESVDGTSSSGWLDSCANCGLCLVCGLYCVALPLGVFQFAWLVVGTVWCAQLEFANGFGAGAVASRDVACSSWLFDFVWWYLGACWVWVIVNGCLSARVHRSHVRLFFRGGLALTETDP